MTEEGVLKLFRQFVGDKPDLNELKFLVEHVDFLGKNEAVMQVDERIFTETTKRPAILVFSSCHGEQIQVYLKKYRPEVLEQNYLHVVYSHRLQLQRPMSNNRLLWGLFANADSIICNILSGKFGEFSTDVLFKWCKPDCKIVSFVPPCCACWWPVAPHFGEEGVVRHMREGADVEGIIAAFLDGRFKPEFDFRFKDQVERLAYRERNRDVGLSEFIRRHYKTTKMAFTTNHPSHHVIAYLTDECLARLGYKKLGEDHALAVDVNAAEFGNHWCETSYEFDYYGFTYPQRFVDDWGGANNLYPAMIREVFERRQAVPEPFVDPEDDY